MALIIEQRPEANGNSPERGKLREYGQREAEVKKEAWPLGWERERRRLWTCVLINEDRMKEKDGWTQKNSADGEHVHDCACGLSSIDAALQVTRTVYTYNHPIFAKKKKLNDYEF